MCAKIVICSVMHAQIVPKVVMELSMFNIVGNQQGDCMRCGGEIVV